MTYHPILTAFRAMSTRDVTHLTDITTRQQSAADGSFQRPASSFRKSIEKGGEFEPEKGEFQTQC